MWSPHLNRDHRLHAACLVFRVNTVASQDIIQCTCTRLGISRFCKVLFLSVFDGNMEMIAILYREPIEGILDSTSNKLRCAPFFNLSLINKSAKGENKPSQFLIPIICSEKEKQPFLY